MPPGAMPEQPYTGPGPPPQPSGSSGWRFVLIGCLALIGIAVLLGGACVYFFPDIMTSLMQSGKSEIMGELTDDHTKEQRQEFEDAYDAFTRQIKEKGFMKWARQYEELFREFQKISADQKITVDESEQWSRQVMEEVQGGERPEEER